MIEAVADAKCQKCVKTHKNRCQKCVNLHGFGTLLFYDMKIIIIFAENIRCYGTGYF